MNEAPFAVPESVTFEQGIALAQSLLGGIERGAWPEPTVERAIAQIPS
jgi:hypothetical protein